ncbi:hypothetical protein DFH09DRAFT_1129120 [Mycena vulgaris]|nr:hypothetical protein DFH09DRAFT_1129120 [Mycena vulgaris]
MRAQQWFFHAACALYLFTLRPLCAMGCMSSLLSTGGATSVWRGASVASPRDSGARAVKRIPDEVVAAAARALLPAAALHASMRSTIHGHALHVFAYGMM